MLLIILKVSNAVRPLLMPMPTQTGSRPSGFGVPMGRSLTMAALLNAVYVLVSSSALAVNDQLRPKHKPRHAVPPLKNHVQSVVDPFIIFHASLPPTTLLQLAKMVKHAKPGNIMATIITLTPQHQEYPHMKENSLQPKFALIQMQAPSGYAPELQLWTLSPLEISTQYSPTHVLLGMLSQKLVRQ